METLVHAKLAGEPCVARLAPSDELRPGAVLGLQPKTDRIHLIDPSSEKVIF